MYVIEGTVSHLALLAQRGNWSAMGLRFNGEYARWKTSDVVGLAVVVAVLVAGFWLLWLLSRWQLNAERRGRLQRPFSELAKAHGLNRLERRVCRETAREMSLADPAEVFVRAAAEAPLAARDVGLARLFGEG